MSFFGGGFPFGNFSQQHDEGNILIHIKFQMINMYKMHKLIITNIIKFQNVRKMHHKIKSKKNIKISLKNIIQIEKVEMLKKYSYLVI